MTSLKRRYSVVLGTRSARFFVGTSGNTTGRMRKESTRMKKTAEETRRSTTPAASPPGFASACSQTAKSSLPPARRGPLAHHLGEIDIMSGASEPAGDLPIGLRAASVSDSPVATALPRPNSTGLPDKLKGGIESLSGFDMSDVRVHFNSPRPASLRALAYTQGTHIHVAPRHEKHLPHEAWHVLQQAQGRVKPTMQLTDGVPVNDDQGLEHQADVMGSKAAQMTEHKHNKRPVPTSRLQSGIKVIQRRVTPDEAIDPKSLNVIGENHPESEARAEKRDDPENVIFRRAHLTKKEENDFTVSTDGGTEYGDAPHLIIAHTLSHICEQT